VPRNYMNTVKKVLLSGNYGVVAAQDGYLLLKRGLPPPGTVPSSTTQPGQNLANTVTSISPNLPENFCSYIYAAPDAATQRLQVSFADQKNSINLLGFKVDSNGTGNTFSRNDGRMVITTYWQVNRPTTIPLQMVVLLHESDGKEYFVTNDVADLSLCQSTSWQPDRVVRMTTETFSLQNSSAPNGLAYLSIALLPLTQSSSTIMDMQARLPLQMVNAPGTVTPTRDTNALQLMPITIVK